ncbi:hypothetical protein [Aurantiacibacter poecillastricola]|uniref:hypothetical protein n=1 Tax=Aurantiacibacter poecillastricola TaxID=3064385 RepID=UPI00273E738E|nr:hypothetical protein [Aurantiacibacter sp. 219JJ12-13]MDP5261774.1 hypothetical protein [Aurantiacibacter sp. 219JJ12-13]
MSVVIGADSEPAEVEAAIAAEYNAGDYKHGWSYLYSPLPKRNAPRLVTLGLKPGGEYAEDENKERQQQLSPEESGNAYFRELWNGDAPSPLQSQIHKLRELHYPGISPDDIFSFNFIPFRSPTWDAFPPESRQRAARFGTVLLDWTLARITSETTVIGFGLSVVQDRIESWFRVVDCEDIKVGWGNISATVCETPRCKRLILLPHLSRYQIIGRPEFERADEVFA